MGRAGVARVSVLALITHLLEVVRSRNERISTGLVFVDAIKTRDRPVPLRPRR
jgi:hypothetical protein